MRRYPGVAAVPLTVALLLAGCGGDAHPFTSTTTASSTTRPATTVPATTTTPTTTPPTTTTAAIPAFVVGTPGLYPPDPLPGGDGAGGSGCPPAGGPLPDGIWFGWLLEVTPERGRFDPACFYFDEAAEAAAAADGVELYGLHFIRNPFADPVEVVIAPNAPAYSIDNSADTLGFLTLSLTEWPAANGGYTVCPGEGCSVWLYVNGGRVTEVLEQYLP